MHEDAVKNYESAWGWERIAPNEITWKNSREKVLSLWNDTRYQELTGDSRIEHRTPQLIYALNMRLSAKRPKDWAAILLDFEKNGWHGSPTSE